MFKRYARKFLTRLTRVNSTAPKLQLCIRFSLQRFGSFFSKPFFIEKMLLVLIRSNALASVQGYFLVARLASHAYEIWNRLWDTSSGLLLAFS